MRSVVPVMPLSHGCRMLLLLLLLLIVGVAVGVVAFVAVVVGVVVVVVVADGGIRKLMKLLFATLDGTALLTTAVLSTRRPRQHQRRNAEMFMAAALG